MPFNGLHPFLQSAIFLEMVDLMYQCPSTGCIHFYLLTKFEKKAEKTVYQCPSTGCIHFYPATWEAPVYKALKGAFSPRFFKLLQKCYILPFFCFSKILLLICILFYHIFIVNARIFLTPG